MPRFDDVIIYGRKQFRVKLNYIHGNPVKAGLVANAIDYKYSSAKDWLTDQKGPIDIDKNYCTYI
jgi:putative transposase